MTDPFGNSLVGPPVTAAIPAGTHPAASTYAASVRADNPAWQWRLGETSGTNAYDRAGSNDQVLDAANARNIAGALLNEADAATNFPGTSDTGPVQGVSRYWQPGPQEFSLEAWVRTSTTSGGKIIGFGDRNNGAQRFERQRPEPLHEQRGPDLLRCAPRHGDARHDQQSRDLSRQPVAPRRRDTRKRGDEAVRRRRTGRGERGSHEGPGVPRLLAHRRRPAVVMAFDADPRSDHCEPRRDRRVPDRALGRPDQKSLRRQRPRVGSERTADGGVLLDDGVPDA